MNEHRTSVPGSVDTTDTTAKVVAAARRVCEVWDGDGPLWAALDALEWAMVAQNGNADAREDLATNPAWQLTEDGLLPASDA